MANKAGSDEFNLESLAQNFRFDLPITEEDRKNYRGGWRFHRHRSERVDPNATMSAKSVLNSIKNGFEKEDLINICRDLDNDRGVADNDKKRKRS